MTVIDVSGCGSGAVFLIKGKANLLFEAGMAYAADQMVENIKRELGDAELDAVLLSHSHYDHVAGLPAVRKAWPGIKTIAADLSLSRNTVKRAIRDLEKANLIRKEPHYRENGSATSNRYYIL